MRTCPYCGMSNSPGVAACSHCFMEMGKAKDDDALQPQLPKVYGVNAKGQWMLGAALHMKKRKNKR